MIHCGVAIGSECISIEKQAFNTDYEYEDVNGKCPNNLVCVPDGRSTRTTKLHVDNICKTVNQKLHIHNPKSSCESSTDPGRFVSFKS